MYYPPCATTGGVYSSGKEAWYGPPQHEYASTAANSCMHEQSPWAHHPPPLPQQLLDGQQHHHHHLGQTHHHHHSTLQQHHPIQLVDQVTPPPPLVHTPQQPSPAPMSPLSPPWDEPPIGSHHHLYYQQHNSSHHNLANATAAVTQQLTIVTQATAANPRVPTPRSPFEWMKKTTYPPTINPGKTRTKDKYRVVYTDHQRLELEKEFHYSRYITIRRKTELALTLGLSERQVKIWFQNRRAKERKQLKKRDEQLLHKEKIQHLSLV